MLGLDKLAAGEEQTEVASPEQPMNNDSTTISCLSDCMYAQNPEKTCMLKNITLNMSKEGTFECGQYMQVQAEQPVEQPNTVQPAQTGLAKVDRPGAPAPAQKPEQTGLDKVKQK